MPSRNLAILVTATVVSMVCYHTAARHHYGSLLAHAIGEISDHFVRPVDERELFEGAMDGMIRRLDPYSDYIPPQELSAFDEELGQEFGGIGVVVEVNPDSERLTVLSPLPDTPAYAAGMRAGDQILAIDDQSTQGFQIQDAVGLMRGKPGTILKLSILHAGDVEPIVLELERAIIPVASVLGDIRNPDGTWQFRLESHPEIGYIRLASFGEKTAAEMQATLGELQPQIQGLIIDLRGNGGGLLNAAVSICDQFIDEGKIVSIRGRDVSRWEDYRASAAATIVDPSLPVVILIDKYSASASEIMAACLQDNGRAKIVGTRSWGKGTVQTVMYFEGGKSRLKLTIATYWRPNGKNIHRHVDATLEDAWGVSPDQGYAVETDEETFEKLHRWRRERDKVSIEKTPPPSADLLDSEDPAVDSATTESTDDLRDFQDPQLQRAIEAIQDALDTRGAQGDAA